MIKVFAKKGTSEKMLVPYHNRIDFRELYKYINKEYGGTWVFVETVELGERVIVDDGVVYNGYTGNQDRYISQVDKL